MIGDLRVTANLEFTEANSVYGDDFDEMLATRSLSTKGVHAIRGTQIVTPTDGIFPKGSLAKLGYIYLINDGDFLLDTPDAPTIFTVGTAGTTTYTYKVVAKQLVGYTVASAGGTIATGNATLSATNYNIVAWRPVDNAVTYDLYRTAGGAAQGRIGFDIPPTITYTDPATGLNYVSLNDTGLAATPTLTAPATTPYDFSAQFGGDGTNYPLMLRGTEIAMFKWNATDIHHKSVAGNTTKVRYLFIDA